MIIQRAADDIIFFSNFVIIVALIAIVVENRHNYGYFIETKYKQDEMCFVNISLLFGG